MADGYIGIHTRRASTTSTHAVPVASGGLVAGLHAFKTSHGGATAVIEYAGRKGAKILLVGGDGAQAAEHFAESTDAAREACARAGVTVEGEWERELTEQMHLGADLWGGRGRRALTR
jgi:hypothetical protein